MNKFVLTVSTYNDSLKIPMNTDESGEDIVSRIAGALADTGEFVRIHGSILRKTDISYIYLEEVNE